MSDIVARRYAQALFDLARERESTGRWREELGRAAEALGRDEVRDVLRNPRVTPGQRVGLALAVLEDVSPPVRNLVQLLVERDRGQLLPEVLRHYDELSDAAGGVVRAEVTAAIPLDGELEAAVVRSLRERLGTEVDTSIREDPSIIGGLVIRIGDRVIDNSVRTHLQQLRASLA